MKKRIALTALISAAALIIMISAVFVLRSGVVSYAWNEAVSFITGVDRNENIVSRFSRTEMVYSFADKAEMTISNRIEGKEDKDIDCLNMVICVDDNTKYHKDVINDWIELYYINDGVLFIATKDKFYVFDYINYPPEKYDNFSEADSDWLTVYSEMEFAEQYPDYENYKWEYGWESKKERAKEHHPNLLK